MTGRGRRVLRQTFWGGAMRVVRIPAGLLLIALNTRILGVEGYGYLTVINAVTTLVHGLAALPGGETVLTFATRSMAGGRRDEAGAILRFTLVLSLGMAAFSYAVIAALAHAGRDLIGIGEDHVAALLLYGLVGLFQAPAGQSLAVLRLADRLSMGFAATLAATLTRVALVAAAWWSGGGLTAVAAAYVVAAAVNAIGLSAATAGAASRAGFRGVLRSFSLRVPPEVVSFQAGVFGKTALGHLRGNLDVILLNHFVGPAATGVYRAARRLVDLVRQPFRVLLTSVHAELSRHWYAADGLGLRRTTLRFTLLATAAAAALFTALAVLREPLIRLVLDDAFSGAAPLVLILIPGSFVAASTVVLHVLPAATGRVKPTLLGSGVGFAVFLALLVILAPHMGAAGAAWASSAYLIVTFVVTAPYSGAILRKSYSFVLTSDAEPRRAAENPARQEAGRAAVTP